MQRLQFEPHALLQPYVKTLWTAERHFAPGDHFDLLPDQYVELVFSFGGSCRIDVDRSERDLPRCYVVGLLDKPIRLRGVGTIRTVAARCYAWGFAALLGVPTDQIAIRDLDRSWQQLADQIADTVARDDSMAALDRLHRFLIERALRTQFDQNIVQTAAQTLADHGGQITIEALADQCFLSQRQLQRWFNAAIGVGPKAFARTLRFEQVRDHLWRDPRSDPATLAYEYGYADHAHLIREFRQFSGSTPRQFADQMRRMRAWLQAHDVAFVQES